MGKKTTNIVDTYLKFLEKGVKNFKWNGNTTMGWVKSNKEKVLLLWFIFITLLTLYEVWETGQCISCDGITEAQLERLGNEAPLWRAFYAEQVYIPYTTFSSYLLGTIKPLIISHLVSIIGLTIFYVGYLVYKRLTKELARFLMTKYGLKKPNDSPNNNR
tara:strand:+ start:361 stop:840 length:480 start_codon:yes stop_codon:yes gene_type:complete